MRRRISTALKYLNQSGTFPSGNPRFYMGPKGSKRVAMPDAPTDHPKFLAAYAKALASFMDLDGIDLRLPAPKGSINEAIRDYLRSGNWTALSDGTRARRRPELDRIAESYGQAELRTLRPEHIRADLKGLDPHPRNNRLKVWRALMAHATESFSLPANPAAAVAKSKTQATDGHASWTQGDVDKFRKHWPIDSAPRLAFELIYWTGARISDAIRLGEGNIGRDGILTFRQGKTGGDAYVPMARHASPLGAQLGDDLDHLAHAIRSRPERHITFMVTAHGTVRSVKAASQWFSKKAREAGLEGKAAHGLRKRRTELLIEAGATPYQVKAWTGHESDSMIALYAKKFDRKRTLTGASEAGKSSNFGEKFQQKGEKL
ncbi:tyrosine-type recombinase/integrase [Roseinatronobacter bogoriensis]|nr:MULTISPECIES: tyrosine-type recombinase/integrase [Rhodobaca]MBB4209147.1 integrase [Rhodobaca bogoriensis DSM 18756]TDW36325.1 phage integrase family protein [Rhodobaca barguzinensis]TDY67547.1 phage integrase family protein [Rhodobaca bogoriensis DSM 18756]